MPHVLKIEAISIIKVSKIENLKKPFSKYLSGRNYRTYPNKVNDVFSLLDVHLCDAPTRSRYVHYVGLEEEKLFFLFLFFVGWQSSPGSIE